MQSKKYLILLFFAVPSMGAFFGDSDNSEKLSGETCTLGSNKLGVCTDILDCEPAKALFDKKRYNEVVYCGFVGKKQLVCCPKSVGTSISEPIKQQQSPKFVKTLCQDFLRPADLSITNHIIDGEKATAGEFPYQVALGYAEKIGDKPNFDCGGSLIAEDYVLTAAHCANNRGQIPMMVRLGRTSLDLSDTDDDSIAEDIEIDKIELHKEYKRYPRQNDIALIKLKRPVRYSETIKPVCITKENDFSNKNLTITGFGRFESKSSKKSDWLLKGTVHEIPLEQCKISIESLEKRLKIADTQICTLNEKGVDGCQGDSGGPMVYEDNKRPKLVGIISYGSGCGGKTPAVYTRVNKYLDWINEKMILLG